MTSSRHCHRVHQNKAGSMLCFSVLWQALWLCVCVGVLGDTHTLPELSPVVLLFFFFFPLPRSSVVFLFTHADLLYQRRHCKGPLITWHECIRVYACGLLVWLCECVCLFWWRLVPSSFITGLSQRDHSCFLIFLYFFSSLLFDKHFEPSHVCQRSV